MERYYTIFIVAMIAFATACTSETSSECQTFNDTDAAVSSGESTKPEAPTAIPGSVEMATVIGPVGLNVNKWGPDPNEPFSWPGRVIQIDSTFPQEPSEQLIYEIRLPTGSSLHKVHVWADPVDGHSTIPASRAQTMLWTHNGGLTESNAVASTVTLDDSIPSYEYRSLLTMELDEPYVMKADTRVFIYVFGEWGTGSMPGLAIDTPEIAFSPP